METIGAFSTAYPLEILIAENDPDAQATTRELLLDLGYSPAIAATGTEVLRMTTAQRYDVILMDLRMPGLEKVLAEPKTTPGARPIIIAMSGIATPDIRQRSLEAMMDHSISKPMDQNELTLQLKACAVLTGKCRIRK